VAAGKLSDPVGASVYEIRIEGRLSKQVAGAFAGMDATVGRGETVLRGPVLDQAALYGLLDRVQALGLQLIEVRRLPEGECATRRSSSP